MCHVSGENSKKQMCNVTRNVINDTLTLFIQFEYYLFLWLGVKVRLFVNVSAFVCRLRAKRTD